MEKDGTSLEVWGLNSKLEVKVDTSNWALHHSPRDCITPPFDVTPHDTSEAYFTAFGDTLHHWHVLATPSQR